MVSGPATVIEAIAAGKEAAISIDRYLQGQDIREGRPVDRQRVKDIPKKNTIKKERAAMPELNVSERVKSFKEVEAGFDENNGSGRS